MVGMTMEYLEHLLFRRHDTSSFTASEKAELLRDPYEESPRYARAAIYFILAAIGLAGLANLFTQMRSTRSGRQIAKMALVRRSNAGLRYLACSQPRAIAFIRFPTWGTILLIVSFWTYILLWSLAARPYYRSRWNVGSPPLAIRTGLFALGCFPFILALGAKWNWVSFVTGYSHEKFQVFHQWLSHLFLILSLLHTFPFVMAGREIRPNTDGLNPHHYSQIYYSGWVKHKVYYWSGIAALVCLVVLCWGSLPPIRKRFYEAFKYLHVVSAIMFTAFFYIHCNGLLGTWHYFWATAILYLSSIAMRFGLLFVRNGVAIPTATVELLSDSEVRITVNCPGHRCKGGQHVFLNFIKARPFESHPFTVANAPYLHPNAEAEDRTMILLLRISTSRGLGPALLSLAASGEKTPVLIDGPYGGLMSTDLAVHEKVLLLAGGTGISFVSSVLQELCERQARGCAGALKKIEIHWAVKHEDARNWLNDHFMHVLSLVPEGFVDIHFYVTNGTPFSEKDEEKAPRLSKSSSDSKIPTSHDWLKVHTGRPGLATILDGAFVSSPSSESVGIGSCGPSEFTGAVRNAVAKRQKQILFGEKSGAQEVELHTEEFDW